MLPSLCRRLYAARPYAARPYAARRRPPTGGIPAQRLSFFLDTKSQIKRASRILFYPTAGTSAYQYNKIRKKVNRAANFTEKRLRNI